MSASLLDHTALPPIFTGGTGTGATGDRVESFILARLARHWTPRPPILVEQWARERLVIERNMSVEYAGQPYDFLNVPHVRLIFDFLRDPIAEELNVMKSSAAAMSTACMVAIAFYLDTDPRNIMYLISNQDEARKLSKQVMQPFLRQVFHAVVDQEDQANLHLHINGAELFFGSPTESMMRNKQVWLIIEDESDTMTDRLSGDGQDLDVAAKERTKNTRGRKIIRLCTPLKKFNPALDPRVDQPGSRIHRHYLRGDQREWRVPCPRCAMMQPILREDLHHPPADLAGRWDLDAIIEATYWKCPTVGCGEMVYDRSVAKARMMRAGQWVPTQPAVSRRVWSAQHTDTCSIVGNASWGQIMSAVREAERDPVKLAAVLRSHFGQPEDATDAGADRTVAIIKKHCGAHRRGQCPIVPSVVAMAADVQKDASYFPWMQAAADPFGNLHVIDCGEANSFDELTDIYRAPIPLIVHEEKRPKHPDGSPVNHVYCTHGVIDSGHSAKEDEANPQMESVYRFCAGSFDPWQNRFLWVPLKGAGGKQIKDLTDDSSAKLNSGVTIPLHRFQDSAFKRMLYHIRLSDPDCPHPQKSLYPFIRLFAENGADDGLTSAELEEGQRFIAFDDLCQELTAERIMDGIKKVGRDRIPIRYWGVPHGRKNNLGDTLKMITVAIHLIMRTLAAHAATHRNPTAA